MTLQLARRFSTGFSGTCAYTLAKSEDTARHQHAVVSDAGRQDPSSSKRPGPDLLDQRHTFVASLVARRRSR